MKRNLADLFFKYILSNSFTFLYVTHNGFLIIMCSFVMQPSMWCQYHCSHNIFIDFLDNMLFLPKRGQSICLLFFNQIGSKIIFQDRKPGIIIVRLIYFLFVALSILKSPNKSFALLIKPLQTLQLNLYQIKSL